VSTEDDITRTPEPKPGPDRRPVREKLAPLFAKGRMRLVEDASSSVVVGVPATAKPIAFAESATLTIEKVIAFGRKVLGREPTPEELAYMKKRLAHLPEK